MHPGYTRQGREMLFLGRKPGKPSQDQWPAEDFGAEPRAKKYHVQEATYKPASGYISLMTA